jgi:hypothetical protein
MCKRCHKREEEAMGGKLGVYHGVMGGPLPNESHIRVSSESKRSKWNIDKQLQEAAAHLKAAGGAGVPMAVKKAAAEAKKAEKDAAAALRAAAAAAKKEEVELKRAATAAEKAVKAAEKAARASEARPKLLAMPAAGMGAVKRRQTQRKKKSSSSSSSSNTSSGSNTSSYRSSSSRKSRRRASPIYRAASGQSARGPAYVNRWAPGTPLRSENMGNANPETLERIMDNLAGLPELQRPLD